VELHRQESRVRDPDPVHDGENAPVSRSARIDDERSRAAITAWSERPWGTPWADRDDVIADATTFNEITVWTQGMMPPERVTLARDGSARGGEVWAPLGTDDFETLALAVAFLMATAPPAPPVGPSPEDREAAALAALPELDRQVFELRREREDGTWTTAAEISAQTGLSEREVGDAITRAIRALVRANPPPPTDVGSTGLHVVRIPGEDIGFASTWGAPSAVVHVAHRLVNEISRGLDWRPVSPDGDRREILWAPGSMVPFLVEPPPEQLPFEVTCPKRGDGHLVARRARQTGLVFWGCSAYPRCDFTTNDQPTGSVHDVTRAVQEETVAAHSGGRGAVARRGESGHCLTCGASVELPPGNLVGVRLPGWACPEHGNADVVILTSRDGRVYGMCNVDDCEEFDDGLTPEQRATERVEAERRRKEQLEREEQEKAERRSQLLADQRAPTCANCGRVERLHAGETHSFAGGTLAHATPGLIHAGLVVVVIAALWLFWVSATTPDAPFHSLTGPLLCLWDWKGTACQ
jgi:ssDNA-binding Zn-finger/Zn-ribbon topoisomerase 1